MIRATKIYQNTGSGGLIFRPSKKFMTPGKIWPKKVVTPVQIWSKKVVTPGQIWSKKVMTPG